MTIRNFTKKSLLLACALPLLAGTACAPMVAEHGNMLEDYQMKDITPGKSTRSDVLRTFGSPTNQGTFNDSTWYYVGMETEKHGIMDPKVTKERVVTVTFDDSGIVKTVKDSDGSDGIKVPYAKQTTPAPGNDLTVMQQFLGNLGRFNPQDKAGAVSTTQP